MSYLEKHHYAGVRSEKEILKLTWEGEIFGVGMFEAMAEKYPEHAEPCTACATMEWLNVHLCEEFGHDAGIHITLDESEKLAHLGAALVRKFSFEHIAKLTVFEAAHAAGPLYKKLSENARTPELRKFADLLFSHEYALSDWLKSELDGKSDGAVKIFEYLEKHGISREEAVTPRKDKSDFGGDRQQLVLAIYSSESQADQAAKLIRNWEKASDHMKVDGIGVLVKDKEGKIKQHKLGKQAGRKGLGVGVVLGLLAAIPTGGLSAVGAAAGGAVGGGIIGRFFHKGLKLTDEQVARLHDELDAGQAMVGVLAWDFEAERVKDKLVDLGATRQSIVEVAEVPTGSGST